MHTEISTHKNLTNADITRLAKAGLKEVSTFGTKRAQVQILFPRFMIKPVIMAFVATLTGF